MSAFATMQPLSYTSQIYVKSEIGTLQSNVTLAESFPTTMSDPRLKQLKIKTGVLKRVGKEKLSYRNPLHVPLMQYPVFFGGKKAIQLSICKA